MLDMITGWLAPRATQPEQGAEPITWAATRSEARRALKAQGFKWSPRLAVSDNAEGWWKPWTGEAVELFQDADGWLALPVSN